MNKKGNAVFHKYIKPFEKYFKMADELVEISINEEYGVWLEKRTGEREFKNDKDMSLNAIKSLAVNLATMAGEEFSAKMPIFSGLIPFYNYRVQINMFSMVESGIALSIRIGRAECYPLTTYTDPDTAKHLEEMIKIGKTILIVAGTGAGKTTLLNSMLIHIPLDQRIVTLQDTPELIIPHKNRVSLIKSKTNTDIAGLTYQHFIDSITRLAPDRILIGEIDTQNTLVFLNLATSGHSGSISTFHSDNRAQTMERLCNNASFSGSKGTVAENTNFINASINIFVFLEKRTKNKKHTYHITIEEN